MGAGEKIVGLILLFVGGWLIYQLFSGGDTFLNFGDTLIGYGVGAILALIGLYMFFRKSSQWPYHQ
ncbi:MAG: hypothetical protein AABW93_02545 [Nanoarchaeota archaeon]